MTQLQPPGRAERLLFSRARHGCPAIGTGEPRSRIAAARRPSSPIPFPGALRPGDPRVPPRSSGRCRQEPPPSVTPSRGSDPTAEQPRETVTVQMSRFRPPGSKSQSPRAATPEQAFRDWHAGREGDGEVALPQWEGLRCRLVASGAGLSRDQTVRRQKRASVSPRKRVLRRSRRDRSGFRAVGAGATHKMAAEAVAPRRWCLPALPSGFLARGCHSQCRPRAPWGRPTRGTACFWRGAGESLHSEVYVLMTTNR